MDKNNTSSPINFIPLNDVPWQELAKVSGCHDIACLNPSDIPQDHLLQSITQWRQQGNAGSLTYIDDRLDILAAPFASRPWAKAAIIISFQPEQDDHSPLLALPMASPKQPAALIAPYAINVDYHITGRRIMNVLASELAQLSGMSNIPTLEPPFVECCVDSRPVMEKQFARLAGIGIQGMNSLIRNDQLGCRLHLGVIFTSLNLPTRILPATVDIPCDSCRKCLLACPNSVFHERHFDVPKCRAWLASEYRRPLTAQQQKLLGNVLFGCGLCTASCPSCLPPPQFLRTDAQALLEMPAAQLRKIIEGTVLERTGATLVKRNAAVSLARQLTHDQWLAQIDHFLKCSNSPVVQQTILNAE